MNWSASFSILGYPGVLSYIAKGIVFTLVLSVLTTTAITDSTRVNTIPFAI